jgi:hypothetical protein
MNGAIRQDAENELRPIARLAQRFPIFVQIVCNTLIQWTMRTSDF